jgi:surface antigen Omp85-like protein
MISRWVCLFLAVLVSAAPAAAQTRAEIGRQARAEKAKSLHPPKEDFFGIGIDSKENFQTSYALKQSVFHARGGNNPGDLFQLVGRVGYDTPRQSRGEDTRFPSIDDLFTPAQAPGLFQDTDFLRTGATFTVDLTDRPLGPLSGGMYIFDVEKFSDRKLDQFSFSQWTVDLRQFVPIVQGARSVVVRLFATGVSPDSGNDVPYYYMPTLGGAYMVRGLANYRFRDRNVVFTNVEYRYELNAFMTGLAFYDAGTVAPTLSALKLNDVKWDYGFGVRFGFLGAATMRTEISFGAEGPRLVFKFNDIF